jgi:hypothetical protein
MKKLSFILLILPILSSGQTKTLDGFLGIKFGTTKAASIAAIKAKGGVQDLKSSNPEDLVFDGVTFANRKTSFIRVSFINNKLYQGDIFLAPSKEPKLIELFETIVEELNDVYGEGKVYKSFKSPFEEGDGYEITALTTGHAEYNAYWFVNSSVGAKNAISLKITESGFVKLSYQDDKLIDIVIDKQKAEKAKDY